MIFNSIPTRINIETTQRYNNEMDVLWLLCGHHRNVWKLIERANVYFSFGR